MYVNGYDVRGVSLELESDFEDKRAIYSSTDRIFPSISFVFAKRRVITRFEQFEYLPSLSLHTFNRAFFRTRSKIERGGRVVARREDVGARQCTASARSAH